MRVGMAYVGSTKMIGFTSAGGQVSLNPKVYESHAGDMTTPYPSFRI